MLDAAVSSPRKELMVLLPFVASTPVRLVSDGPRSMEA